MKCIEKDCTKEAIKKYVGKDGVSVDLCEDHYKLWAVAKGVQARSKRMWLGWFAMYLVGKFSVMLLILMGSPQIEAGYIVMLIILLQAVELLTFPLMLRKYEELQEE